MTGVTKATGARSTDVYLPPTDLGRLIDATAQRTPDGPGELHVGLFGRLTASIGDHEITGLDGRKVQELLCYLLLFRNRLHHRELLAERLYGTATNQSRKCLRQALWQLQPLAPYSLLHIESHWVGVRADASVWVDVAELENAHVLAKQARCPLDECTRQVLCRAFSVYRGELLEGCYEDWCCYERERLQMHYLSLVETLLQDAEQRGSVGEGVTYGQTILRYDRAHEPTHRRLMALYNRIGDRSSALRQFHSCVEALDAELDASPSPSTVELFNAIRDGVGTDSISAWSPGNGHAPRTGMASEKQLLEAVLQRIADLESLLLRRLRDIDRLTGT